MKALTPLVLSILLVGCGLSPLNCLRRMGGNGGNQNHAQQQEMSPSPTGNTGDTYQLSGLTWIRDSYETALAEAKRTGKPIFVDFTGYTCTNCRWMERNMFTVPAVQNALREYVLVQLYTDGRDSIHMRNRQMQKDRFNTIDLPLYALMSPNDSVLAKGVFTRDTEAFALVLDRGLSAEF